MSDPRLRARALLYLLQERSRLNAVLYALDDTRYGPQARALRQAVSVIDMELMRRHLVTQARLLDSTAEALPEVPLELVCVCAWCGQLVAYCRCVDEP